MDLLMFLVAVAALIVAARSRATLQERIEALERAVTELRVRASRQHAAEAPAVARPEPAPPAVPAARVAPPPAVASPPRAPAPATPRPAPTAPSTASVPVGRPGPTAAEVSPGTLDDWRATAGNDRPAAGPPSARPSWLRELISGGNLIARAGVVVLFFGVAFLLRYVAEHSHLSIEWRLTGVAAAGVVLLALGWRLRSVRRGYALALQSAGVGVMYLTVFASFRLFHVLPSPAAFALLAVVAALSAVLAILEDSLAFAMLGTAGGFLAPVLASTHEGNHVALFSYFAVLDLAVVAIAWFRSWRPLNLLAFAFTFGIGTAWGVLQYRPEQFATTEPFLVLFFLMFVTIAVLFALRRPPELAHYVDGTLIFGAPVVGFALQAGLVRDLHYGRAYSALVLAAFYLLLARGLVARRRDGLRLLIEAFLALGIAFATLAVPFALEGRWTAATWALEGAAVLWVGLRQQRSLPVAAGLGLQLLAAIAYFWEGIDLLPAGSDVLLLNSRYLGAMLIGASALLIAARLRRPQGDPAPWFSAFHLPLLGWGLLWWLAAGFWEMERHLAPALHLASGILYSTATAAAASALGARIDWRALRAAALLIVPGLALFAVAGAHLVHPFADGGWWAWPPAAVFAVFIVLRDDGVVPDGARTAIHSVGYWLLTWVATQELAYQVGAAVQGASIWPLSVRGLVPALALIVAARSSAGERWPFGSVRRAYAGFAGAGLAAYLVGFVLYTAVESSGTAVPLPYVPLVNPMDLTEGFALLAVVAAIRAPARAGFAPEDTLARFAAVVAGFVAFLWLNALALRTLHHYAGVPYTLDGIAASTLAQTTLTIFWSVLALLGMGFASRSGRRFEWLAGATLLLLVTVKLFLVDLSRTGTIPRIVSFLGVGALMLVIGYLSPLPPAREEKIDGA